MCRTKFTPPWALQSKVDENFMKHAMKNMFHHASVNKIVKH